MDPDVAKSAIESVNNFEGLCRDATKPYEKTLEAALASNDGSVKEVYSLYQNAQSCFVDCMKKDDATPEEKKYYSEKIVEAADKAAKFDEKTKSLYLMRKRSPMET